MPLFLKAPNCGSRNHSKLDVCDEKELFQPEYPPWSPPAAGGGLMKSAFCSHRS